jgi:hypothetical protein
MFKPRAAAVNRVQPSPPLDMSLKGRHIRRRDNHPRVDSGTYMPTGPLASTSNTTVRPPPHYRPQAPPSNPFEDPQYEYGVTVPTRRPMRERQDVLEDQLYNAPGSGAKRKSGKAYRGHLRSRVQALFTSYKRSTSKDQQHVGSALLKGEGTHFARGTMRGLHYTDREREM